MPLSLQSFRAGHRQAEATAAELDAAAKQAAERAAQLAAQRDEARKAADRAARKAATEHQHAIESGGALVAEAERRLADVQAQMGVPSRPAPDLRGLARTWLWGDRGTDVLTRLAAQDPAIAVLGAAQHHAGAVMRELTEAGVEGDHELWDRIDRCECAAWRAVVSRIRALAGEAE